MSSENIEVLLSSARRTFMFHGYHGSSIRILLSELQISAKQFYDVLGGKKSLAKRLIVLEQSGWENVFKKAHKEAHSSGKETLKAVVDIVLENHLEECSPKGSFLANLSCELSESDKDVQALIAQAYNSVVCSIAGLLQTIDKKDRSCNDREIALFILSALEGSCILAKSDNDFWEMKKGFELIKQFIENL